MSKWENKAEIKRFREYLRIPSVHPNINYEPCVDFLKKEAKSINLPIAIYYPANDKCPVVVISWIGSQPKSPSIVLNSHMDVATVDEEQWTYPPFVAEMDEDGNIYARGAQNMKCCGTQYLAAIKILMKKNVEHIRTIHILFVPDKEIGSEFGMQAFVKSNEFQLLKVGFLLDESRACPLENTVNVYYAERTHCIMELLCEGETAHDLIFLENTAGEKVHLMIEKFNQFQDQELQKLRDNPNLKLGDISSVELTMIDGGEEMSVIPTQLKITYQCHLAINVDPKEFHKQVEVWCEEVGGGITVNSKAMKVKPTLTDNDNPYWTALERAISKINRSMKIDLSVCPFTTDSVYVRELGIPVFGFMPMPNTPDKCYDPDEFLNADTYLNGIKFYVEIITNLGNAPEPKKPAKKKK